MFKVYGNHWLKQNVKKLSKGGYTGYTSVVIAMLILISLQLATEKARC